MRLRWVVLLVLAAAGAGCGSPGGGPRTTASGADSPAAVPAREGAVTKNTSRIAGGSSPAVAAGVASAVHPGEGPRAVALVADGDWAGGLPAAALMAPPLRAPLLAGDDALAALSALDPGGARELGEDEPEVVRVGAGAPAVDDAVSVEGRDPFALARAVAELRTRVAGAPAGAVLVAGIEEPEHAMAAAGWSAKTGDPLLWTRRGELPADTRSAIRALGRPDVYVLGPPDAVSRRVARELRRLGRRVTRIAGETPEETAVAFARFSSGAFGWGVVDPGHGIVLVPAERPLDAAVAAPLSSSGSYGPLLVTRDGDELPDAVREYLLDIRPTYEDDPVHADYNHGWLIGDDLSLELQAEFDALLEIRPVDSG